jgi:RND family efflux transporter MFP subunit
LDDADARAQIAQAETGVKLAELKLADLTADADPAALAAAEATLAGAEAELARLREPATAAELTAAQETLRSAQAALSALSNPDPDKLAAAKASITLAEINVRAAQAAYDKVAPVTETRDGTTVGIGETRQAADLWQATTNLEKAKAEYNALLAGPDADALAAARAKVASTQSQLDTLRTGASALALAAAEAKVSQALAQLAAVSEGADANALESARLGVVQAQLSLDNAQRQLANTELKAPGAGTVLAVQAQAGESVGSSPIITLADLSNQSVRFWVEEADLRSVAVGNPVSVVFDALPDLAYPGKITAVDPALVTVEGTLAVQAWADLELNAHPVQLLSGMTAAVEVLAGETKGALLIPVQALRELAPGSYAVFVVKDDGQLEMRTVTVGLRDFANAEILSGLAKGEVVSTGTVETE